MPAGNSEMGGRTSLSLRAEAPANAPDPAPMQAGTAPYPWASGMLCLPRVSVVVTSYNYAAYIASALDSIAAQDYPNLECIIVDDASEDASVAVIENWLVRNGDRRFRLIASPVNQGQLASFAEALVVADGEFVATLDADDFWLPGFLRRHVQAHLNTEAVVSASCSDLVQVDREGRAVAGTARWREFPRAEGKAGMPIAAGELPRLDSRGAFWSPSEAKKVRMVPSDLFRWHWSATSAMMFRRGMVDLMMPTEPRSVPISADHYLVVLCHFFTGSLVLDEALGAYRRHGGNLSSSLPLLGTTANKAPGNQEAVHDRNFSVMRDHVLEKYDTLVSIFGSHAPRKFLDAVERYLRRRGISVGKRRRKVRVPAEGPAPRLSVLQGVRRLLQPRQF